MEEKKVQDEVKEEQELDLDDLDQVSGGANPFANIKRVENQQLDDSIRNKV